MVKVRLRTKFLLSMIVISAGLTTFNLLLVRQNIRSQIQQEIVSDLRNSVGTFQSFQREQEITLNHAADLLADLPNLRALMTTHDEVTIQDGSAPLWRLAGSDLFVLADRGNNIMALHTSTPGFTRQMAKAALLQSLDQGERWWFGAQHLYEVFVEPIYFGPASENKLLGSLIIGYEIDGRVASQISRIASSKVVFYYGDSIVTSTLGREMTEALTQHRPSAAAATQPAFVELGSELFLQSSVDLSPSGTQVRLMVLKSYDEATASLQKLNRLLLALGVVAVVVGSALVFLISHTFTRPLSSLVAGVSALERGDFGYALDTRGGDEAAELARAFDRMRESLLRTQQNLIESERLATIGRMANSISHDLRHSLAAIVANAEFLCEAQLSREQREELYQEVQTAVHRMTELIDSLLEFSRTRASLRPTYGSVRVAMENAIRAVKANPEFHGARMEVRQNGTIEGWFDHRKLERAFFNLLLNACEAAPGKLGAVTVEMSDVPGGVEVRVADRGRGIPESIRNTLFEPFVSQGKENGTGLGLTVVQKIVQDHGGEITVESTSPAGTLFRMVIPHPGPAGSTGDSGVHEDGPAAARASSGPRS